MLSGRLLLPPDDSDCNPPPPTPVHHHSYKWVNLVTCTLIHHPYRIVLSLRTCPSSKQKVAVRVAVSAAAAVVVADLVDDYGDVFLPADVVVFYTLSDLDWSTRKRAEEEETEETDPFSRRSGTRSRVVARKKKTTRRRIR